MANFKRILICADDYAQNISISEAIVLLASIGRINAISCLVNMKSWQKTQQALIPLKSTTYLGLHLNFTLGQALSERWRMHYGSFFWTLSTVITKSYLRNLDFTSVKAEILAQLDAFTETLGMMPDFIDGHQHVHQLPIIREALFSIASERRLKNFWRCTVNGWQDFLKASSFPKPQLLALLGGLAFRRDLQANELIFNNSFGGIYNFTKSKDYKYFFKDFLKNSSDGGLIICHPGFKCLDLAKDDPLSAFRPHEFDYLMSECFIRDLRENKIKIYQKTSLNHHLAR